MAGKRTHVMMCLAQCGDTRWESEGRLHGWTDLPMSDAGRAAINALSSRLDGSSIATIYHPGDEAAVETAQILARAAGAKTKEIDDLADPNLGLFEGLLEKQLAERHPKRYKQWLEDPLSLNPPEGEALADARERVFAAVARTLKKSRAQEVAFVLHPIAFGFLRCWLADRPASELRRVLADSTRFERYAVATSLLERLRDVAGRETTATR